MEPILLDTDPGSDIDDALALAYLLRQPRCELLGVTTVTGDTVQRAGIVEVVCRAYGREDVPIVAGAQRPIAHGPGQPHVPHYAAIADRTHRNDYRPNEAVHFLRESIRARPGEITLLSIGPLTNVALLFALDPEIPGLLKGFVSMLGSFFETGRNEWNAIADPAATTSLFGHSVPQTLVGLDVTLRCHMAAEEVRARFAKPPHDVLLAMAEKWFEHTGKITFHDPLAAALIFEPELCKLRRGTVSSPATADKDFRMGHTFFSEGDGPHFVAETVDHESFFAHYFEVVGA